MRYLLTSLLCFFTLSLTAQESITYPYNPDEDVNGLIASPDLLGLLGLYGDEFSPAEIMIGDTGLTQWIQILSQTLQAQQELINQLQSDSIALPDGIFSGDILIWNGTAWIPESPPVYIITDDNIHAAVDMWLLNEDVAEATYGHISEWDVSSVTDMSNMFHAATSFNGDLSIWDVSSVTDMSYMFYKAENFNGNLSSWDVSSVTTMSSMFGYTNIFNGDLSSWDVSSVTSLGGMFYHALSFNSDLSSWDVSSVTSMYQTFKSADNFNGDLSSWDVSSVTSMYELFGYTNIFNSDLSSWDVSSVTDMGKMFYNALSFNSDLSSWDVSSVMYMYQMFDGASALSEENQCALHTSFYSNANWPYDWFGFCPPGTCGLAISHEGYDYNTVLIGEQCWFSENCRYLPEVSPLSEGSETEPYYYVSDYSGTDLQNAKETENYWTYGVLYNWPAVMTDSICPSGWHIPSDGEWTQLTDFLGGESVAGGEMKSTEGWNDFNDNSGNGANSSGWTGLPGGLLIPVGFYGDGIYGNWWSASESGSYSWVRNLGYDYGNVFRDFSIRNNGISARCVRDD